jgi:hypothetical protein
MRSTMNEEDGADVDRLIDLIQNAEANNDTESIPGLQAELDDLLFYIA